MMKSIHSTIKRLLRGITNPIIFEVGAHKGEDTVILSQVGTVHAFECDPRNLLTTMPPNVKVNYTAVSDRVGLQDFWLSEKPGAQWTCSSSLLLPKTHLEEHPQIRFDRRVQVRCTTLNEYCKQNAITAIDFLWMDVQGAEHLVFAGAADILNSTRYIYTEYADNEQFRSQKSLNELLVILGSDWEIVEKWDYDVLLKNNGYEAV